MLHKLEMPLYRPQLESILDFQYQLLSFACTAPALPLTPTILKAKFGEMCGGWLSKRCWKDEKGETRNKFCIELEDLIDYVTRNPPEGPDIITAFSKDRGFYNHLDDPDFEFQYPRLSQDAKTAVAPLMVSFYEKLLETGYPGYIHLCNTELFTRKLLLKSFYQANPRLRVCPGCDGPRPRLSNNTLSIKVEEGEENKKRDYAEIDHFFPKAFYPFFSVHFINLVPLCPVCNIKAKQFKDPLNKSIGKGVLHHTFLPFIKPATPCIEVSMVSSANNLRRVLIKDRQQIFSQRVNNLDTTFELRDNWEHHLEGWTEDLIFQLGGPQSKGNRQKIEREIKKRLMPLAKAQEEDVGQMTYLLVQRGYASYALRNRLELEVLIEEVMDNNAPKKRGNF